MDAKHDELLALLVEKRQKIESMKAEANEQQRSSDLGHSRWVMWENRFNALAKKLREKFDLDDGAVAKAVTEVCQEIRT